MTIRDRRISIRGLTRRFGDVTALAPTNLEIEAGGITGLLGPNGSGKSTLLRMLIGLVPPNAGEATIDGEELRGDGTAVRRRCTFAPGEIALFGEMRAAEHLQWLLRGRGREALRKAMQTSSDLGLPLDKRVHAYSHGMKRQLLFAAALAPDVGVRILDEPSEGLDPNTRSRMLDLLEAEANKGTTILLSSHHLGEVDRVCKRLVFLNKGQLLRGEDADDVRARARRTLRVTFDEASTDRQTPPWFARVEALPGARIEWRQGHMVAELEGDDPRAFLAALGGLDGLPAVREIEYGKLSLQQLYADLYGVEAC